MGLYDDANMYLRCKVSSSWALASHLTLRHLRDTAHQSSVTQARNYLLRYEELMTTTDLYLRSKVSSTWALTICHQYNTLHLYTDQNMSLSSCQTSYPVQSNEV